MRTSVSVSLNCPPLMVDSLTYMWIIVTFSVDLQNTHTRSLYNLISTLAHIHTTARLYLPELIDVAAVASIAHTLDSAVLLQNVVKRTSKAFSLALSAMLLFSKYNSTKWKVNEISSHRCHSQPPTIAHTSHTQFVIEFRRSSQRIHLLLFTVYITHTIHSLTIYRYLFVPIVIYIY